MDKNPSLLKHLRDILILPFTVTCIAPYLLYNPAERLSPGRTYLQILGALFVFSGLCLFVYTVFLFKTQGKGTLAPWSLKQKLVISGPYRFCRNPMITGVLFILIGEAIALSSLSIFIWAATFFTINTIYFIASEEPALLKQFGEEYAIYKRNVPRWIPRIIPYKGSDSSESF